MQDRPLMISSLIEHAATFHADTEIVSRLPEGPTRGTTWGGIRNGAKQVANALTDFGIQPGDRVASLAWNTDRHLALYYGVSGTGAVMHTVNPRLFPEQIEYIINHAEDQILFFDITFAALVAELAPRLTTVRRFVVMTDAEHLPDIDVGDLHCWDWIDAQSAEFGWPEFDERSAASLCYTSGTTGNPKGVLYSHRSTVLHALAQLSRDTNDIHSGSALLLVVPMFHANAWGMPYAAAMAGARLVLPGPHLDGASVYDLIKQHRVTSTLGVPTVSMMLFSYLDDHPELDPHELGLEVVGMGGSAMPRSILERISRDFGAETFQGWGMTEISPVGAVGKLLPKHADLSRDEQVKVRLKAGRGIWGVEIKIVDDEGQRLPWDGKAFGEVMVRGPWTASAYFKGDSILDDEGYMPTGDVATIDPDGYLQLVDRAKDVIKSGGEWISSIELEDAAMGHDAVSEAAVIGVPHPKWQERPLLLVVTRQGHTVSRDELLDHLSGKVAKWWLPDDVVFVDELPHTATGKVLKVCLREQYREH